MLTRRTIAMLLCLALGSCAEQNTPAENQSATAEIGYFFGRPPPTWTVTGDELDDFRERLSGLTPTAEPAEFPRFGPVSYRLGDVVGATDFPDELFVQDGIVEIRMGATYTYFTDDRQLENALEDSAVRSGAYAELGLEDTP